MGTKSDRTFEDFKNFYLDNYIIPGLNYCKNNCNECVPQGITIINEYLFISEYCATNTHNSVIIILEKDTGKYIKTVEINDGIWHVGGLCYDGEYIYITANQDFETKNSYIAKFKLQDFLEKDYIFFEDKIETPLNSNAFIEYNPYDKNIYVGEYVLNSFLKGILLNINTNNKKEITSFMQDIEFIEINNNIYTLISRSCSSMNSSLDVWFNNEKIGSFSFPCFLEGITADEKNNILYIIFESAANKYVNKNDIPIDRVIKLDLNKIKKEIQNFQ